MGTAASYIICCVLQPVLCRGLWELPLGVKGAAFYPWHQISDNIKGTATPYINFCHGHCHFVPWALLLYRYILAVDILFAVY